jgi:hypothetical protein
LRLAGRDLGPESFYLNLEPIRPAQVVAGHMDDGAASPELLAVFEFVNHGWSVCSKIGSDDHKQTHAQTDQPPGHPLDGQDWHRQHFPETFHQDLHANTREQFSCR